LFLLGDEANGEKKCQDEGVYVFHLSFVVFVVCPEAALCSHRVNKVSSLRDGYGTGS